MYIDRRRATDLRAIGDTLLLDDLIDQIPSLPSPLFRQEDYLYLIYLVVVSLFYLYYLLLLVFHPENY